MEQDKSVITLTFGDMAENHVGMEKIGKLVKKGEGFQVAELDEIAENLANTFDLNCEIFPLNIDGRDQEEAALLVIRDGVNRILNSSEAHSNLFQEQANLEVDKRAFMYGRVVNKHARWNLCFDDVGHEPDYENGKGRVIAYDNIPLTKTLLDNLVKVIGKKAHGLKGEGNYYYDTKKCGIGFHGDSERRKVIAVRLGASLPIHYQWYRDSEPIGERIKVELNGGDIYIMSEKAVGTDWKLKRIDTLRHATGCDKFTK